MVLHAETLVRDDILLKTPSRYRRQSADVALKLQPIDAYLADPKKERVQQWLQNHPQTPLVPTFNSSLTTDGEASCEYTESDSANRDSDGSEGLADSVATCLPGVGSNSQCTSSEVIGDGSTDHLKDSADNSGSTKIVHRTKRSNAGRPWSVSCFSQLAERQDTNRSTENVNGQSLANHSISESALNTLNNGLSTVHMKTSDSKNSLKKRRMRMRKKQRSESGSNVSDGSGNRRRGSHNSLIKSDSFSSRTVLLEQRNNGVGAALSSEIESEDNMPLPKPNFQLGAYTSNVFGNVALGSLAPLAFYNCDHMSPTNAVIRESSYTGTEDTSNLSEQQAWDGYQEKYGSEAYSEGVDSDGARKLLEFGEDYRNFLESQSDCCSSLSAANNLDSLSPPRNRKVFTTQATVHKMQNKSPSDDDNAALRRRRAVELERRRQSRSNIDSRKNSLEGNQLCNYHCFSR